MGTRPENTHGIQTQTQPNPYPKFGSGPGITLGYPNFGYPILAIVPMYVRANVECILHKSQWVIGHYEFEKELLQRIT